MDLLESKWDLDAAHSFCGSNMPALRHDARCGCFYCLKVFSPEEIEEYLLDDNDCDREGTAICPYCGIDSVIPESAGFPLTHEFLSAMHDYWF